MAHEVDGLLVLPVGSEWQHIRELARSDITLGLMDRILPGVGCHPVGVDNYQASFQAVDYLIARGRRRIACIQPLPHAWIDEERIRGYRDAHAQHEIPIDPDLILGDQFVQLPGELVRHQSVDAATSKRLAQKR